MRPLSIFSTHTTWAPSVAAFAAAMRPDTPPPMTRTSHSSVSAISSALIWRASKATGAS